MPIYDYECPNCGSIFEVIVLGDGNPPPPCPRCGWGQTRKIMAAPAVHIKTDRATARIEKRVRDYLKDGKISDATRFADKARSMVKSEKVKRIADKLHEKTDN
jgi:putative FmdB family regulatory protein